MTLKELSKLYYLNKLIERDTMRIEELEARLGPGSMNLSGMPRSPSPKNMFEETEILLLEVQNRLRKEQEEYIRERIALEEYMRTVEDYQVRLILTYRFVDLMNWRQIAFRIGGNNTEDSVKQRAYRFIKDSQKNKSCHECHADMCYKDSMDF